MKQRVKSCKIKLSKLGYDSFLFSSGENIGYLTGSFDTQGYLLVTRDNQPLYFSNFLYQQKLKVLKDCKVKIANQGSIFKLIAQELKRQRVKNLGFEPRLSFGGYNFLNFELKGSGIRICAVDDFLEEIRAVKSKKEVSLITKSAQMSQKAFEYAKEIACAQMSEKDLSIELEKFLKLLGDNAVAFPPIVASGKNTVFPHHRPGAAKLDKKFFLIDLGSKYYGYCADLTRVFFCGKISLLFKKIFDIVRRAQELSLKQVKDGAKASIVDSAARNYIAKKGFGKYFGHGLGHGVGLSVHEYPTINQKSQDVLREGMVVTIEPAVYLNNRFGIRIEDMVLVKKNKGEILSGDVDW